MIDPNDEMLRATRESQGQPMDAVSEGRQEAAVIAEAWTGRSYSGIDPKQVETVSEAMAAQALQKVFAIRAEGTSQNPCGYGAPYGPPFFIIDTSSAEPEFNWPGELIEQVDDVGEVGKHLRAAQVSALRAALSTATPAGDGVPPGMAKSALDCVVHALMVLPVPIDGQGKRAWASLLEAQTILEVLSITSTAGKG